MQVSARTAGDGQQSVRRLGLQLSAQTRHDRERAGGAVVLVSDRGLLQLPHAADLVHGRCDHALVDLRQRHVAFEQVLHDAFGGMAVALQQLQQEQAGQRAILTKMVEHALVAEGAARQFVHRCIDDRSGARGDVARHAVLDHRRHAAQASRQVILTHVAGKERGLAPCGVAGEQAWLAGSDRLGKVCEASLHLVAPQPSTLRAVARLHRGVLGEHAVHGPLRHGTRHRFERFGGLQISVLHGADFAACTRADSCGEVRHTCFKMR